MYKLFNKQRYNKQSDLVKKYGNYFTVDVGIQEINPKDITGLSLPEKIIKKDNKMKALRKSVLEIGWLDKFPQTLCLERLPTGKYTVSSGGNHRSYLANELGLERIEAFISIIVPENMLIKGMGEIEELFEEQTLVSKEAKKIGDWLNSKGIHAENYKKENELFDSLCNREREIFKEIDDIVYKVAKENNLIKASDRYDRCF
ncbi:MULTISPECIES: hypothetical protein [Bacillaceae]|uniref:ParB/Sulfiredoxin domain-containing protein n=1 Tax=Evansella alkalicola TaxID=745819 RepID=A0ABS6JRZ6_9BACI|nr:MULTISPECIES: hypothetical protein [Bacillaceae]MBU9721346.1 hypothetical protein [Bacillus alkalicola]